MSASKKRIGSNFAWALFSESISKGTIFFTNIFLARILGVENFGLLTIAQTLTFYIWMLVELGIGVYGIREIAIRRDNIANIATPLLNLRVFSAISFFCLYAAILFFVNMPIIIKTTYLGSSIYLIANAFYSDWILKGLEKFKYIAFGNIISSLFFLLTTLILIKSPSDVGKAAFIYSASFFLGAIIFLFIIKKFGIKLTFSFDFNKWYFHLKESIFFSISGGLYLFYIFVPILAVKFFFSSFEVGLFSAPYRLIITISSAGLIINTAFYPVLSNLYNNNKKDFFVVRKNYERLMILLGLPIGIIGALGGDHIINILFGDQYSLSKSTFKILIWLVPLFFLRYSYGCAYSAAGFQKLYNKISFVGVVIICVLCVFLIPAINITGAALAMLFSEFLTLSLMIALFHFKIRQIKNLRG